MSISSKLFIVPVTLGLMSVSNAAQAQSHDFSQNQFRQSSEARLTLAIPFGTERKDSKADPRLAFSVRQYQPQDNFDNSWF